MSAVIAIGFLVIWAITFAWVVWEKRQIDRAWKDLADEYESFDEMVKRRESEMNARSLALHRMEEGE